MKNNLNISNRRVHKSAEVVLGDGRIQGSVVITQACEKSLLHETMPDVPAILISHINELDLKADEKSAIIAIIFKRRESVKQFRNWLDWIDEAFNRIEGKSTENESN
jgi:hypothetical protein